MLNKIWGGMIIFALLAALGQDLGMYEVPGRISGEEDIEVIQEKSELALKSLTNSIFSSASTAVKIAINLIGIMAFFLGLMRIVEKAGAIRGLTKLLKPLLKMLFPDVPDNHPALGAMVMNIASNMLGLGNAATPFGLKAMEELEKLNPEKGTATPAMMTFLVINTSAITLVPATVLSIRAAMDSKEVAIFVIPSVLAALSATIIGLAVVKIYLRLRRKHD